MKQYLIVLALLGLTACGPPTQDAFDDIVEHRQIKGTDCRAYFYEGDMEILCLSPSPSPTPLYP